MILRYATRDDLVQWFGSVPATMRAIVIADDDRVLGVAGVLRGGDHIQAFSAIKDELRQHKILMGRAAVMFKKLLVEAGGPVLALCSPTEPTAPSLLAHLGFKHWAEGVWRHG